MNILARILLTIGLTLTSVTAVFSEPPNLSIVRQDVIKYHNSGLYQRDLSKVIKKAEHFIIQQALLNQNSKNHKKLALVLDIDETSISNYAKMVNRDFTGTRKQIHTEILKANSPAITPMLALYKNAQQHDVKVFFITGRDESERQATKDNLTYAGYSHWSGLYLRPNNYTHHSIIPFKSAARAAITKKGFTIIASIGDQCSDLRGGYALKGFKLPNPYYYLP